MSITSHAEPRAVANVEVRARRRTTAPRTGLDVLETLRRLPAAVLKGQILLIALVVVLHVSIAWAPKGAFHPLLVRLVDVDNEMNFPTWFSSAQWLLMSATLGFIALVVRSTEGSRLRRILWAGSAVLALYLSIDEVAVLHERAGTVLEEFLDRAPEGSSLRSVLGLNSYYWFLAYAPFVVPGVIMGGAFLWKELGKARLTAFLGIFTLLYAAVGLDLIEGRFGVADHSGIPLRIASRPIMLDIALLEESLEMIGVCLIEYAFVRHLASVASRALVAPTLATFNGVPTAVALPKKGQSDHTELHDLPALAGKASSI